MLRLGGVASRTYLVAFPAIQKHFQQQGSTWTGSCTPARMPWSRRLSAEWIWPGTGRWPTSKLSGAWAIWNKVAMQDIDGNLVTAFITHPHSTIRTVEDLKAAAFGARAGRSRRGCWPTISCNSWGSSPVTIWPSAFCEERPTPNADSGAMWWTASCRASMTPERSPAPRRASAGLVAPESVRVFWTSPGYSHCCLCPQ